jgi:hypothetical protein
MRSLVGSCSRPGEHSPDHRRHSAVCARSDATFVLPADASAAREPNRRDLTSVMHRQLLVPGLLLLGRRDVPARIARRHRRPSPPPLVSATVVACSRPWLVVQVIRRVVRAGLIEAPELAVDAADCAGNENRSNSAARSARFDFFLLRPSLSTTSDVHCARGALAGLASRSCRTPKLEGAASGSSTVGAGSDGLRAVRRRRRRVSGRHRGEIRRMRTKRPQSEQSSRVITCKSGCALCPSTAPLSASAAHEGRCPRCRTISLASLADSTTCLLSL